MTITRCWRLRPFAEDPAAAALPWQGPGTVTTHNMQAYPGLAPVARKYHDMRQAIAWALMIGSNAAHGAA